MSKLAWMILGGFTAIAVIRAAHRAGQYDLVQLVIGQNYIVE